MTHEKESGQVDPRGSSRTCPKRQVRKKKKLRHKGVADRVWDDVHHIDASHLMDLGPGQVPCEKLYALHISDMNELPIPWPNIRITINNNKFMNYDRKTLVLLFTLNCRIVNWIRWPICVDLDKIIFGILSTLIIEWNWIDYDEVFQVHFGAKT